MRKLRELSFEEMQGTKTYYLPFNRNAEAQPRVTLVVRRVGPDYFHTGLAICSLRDNFHRLFGRRLARNRLVGNPLTGSASELAKLVSERFEAVSERRDGHQLQTAQLFVDIVRVFDQLTTDFDRLDQNREDRADKRRRSGGEFV